ncbi:unnamed protein product, partial [Rotaria sp. Silwood2]
YLVVVLNHGSSINGIIFDDCPIDDECLEILTKGLSITPVSLQQLFLAYTDITINGIQYLSDMFKKNNTLKHLGLKSSGINDQTVKLLMNVLKNDNNTLETLNLSMNKDLTDACLNYVVEMLEYNQSIRRISFLYCNISMEAQNDFETKISKRKDVSIYFVPKWQRHDAKLSIGEQFVFL